ncbi:ATP-dependent RNA helicase HrpA [Francisella sp. Scap27]|uniref:ATP-dependent RNA helicase HrpA n=1 Tax=Francisella sp. Scap27 TaxID=2589986 RepID=UPI0015BB11D8|nr:ATP-dependent RNA helicase HrpA [Francisella sp. Scap27]QLE78843.1 ATP-dependent RNA helicase HrpA [Francisella sp. Scap27]
MKNSKLQFDLLLNQIPTKFRGKYIPAFRNNKISKEDLFLELELLADEASTKKLPKISYPDLPVAEKVDDIKKLISENQVIVVAGETGSGKSTQLPKICLDMGLGKRGLIGHTQPRRLAARSIASRVASEIGDQSKVSYKIRFSDKTDDNTLVKVMTDGVLLSEIKNDRFLSQYEVIIIDEAHERSLNIDFLMGCIKKILPFRPDLKIIITSATIDHNKFTSYFANAKDITVSGRTYPVEIRYQDDIDFESFSMQERILYAIDELGCGDVLVFLPTERDIHETLAYLNKQDLRFTEVLPLFSRLSNKDQNKIFNPEGSIRRIILATNVAETSLTVPRIKSVIDSGLVRISRYSYRTKVQRLPIEKISQASANQRAGRCGRLSAGVCIRLYSEEDFNNRKEFTDPEILRTNLASVILQMLFLRLGSIDDFPFIDEPDTRFVRDGYKLLFELKAISELNYSKATITQDGSKMATMPLDPKLAKIVIEAQRQGCLKEAISIVSFLSIQDPRERPLNYQQKSDTAHAVDKDKNSDFITILNLANRLTSDLKDLTNSQKKDYFRKNFISPVRFNEWNDIYRQIIEVVHKFKWKLNSTSATSCTDLKPNSKNVYGSSSLGVSYEKLHKALISGFIGNIGFNYELTEYLGARGLKFFIFPGSSQFKRKPKWMFSSEIVETTKVFARNIAKIEPEWIESLASHLIKKNHDEPVWSKKRGVVVANERVSIYGLEIVAKRSIQFAKINEELAREMFIREALVNGEFDTKAYFFNENLKLITDIEDLENKSRRKDILVDEQAMFDHYNSLMPEDVCSKVTFEKWAKKLDKSQQQSLLFDIDKLMQHNADDVTQEKYPDTFSVGNMHLPLEYEFDPLSENDGATLTLPLAFLNDINPIVLEWGVYGFLYEKIVGLLRALPKNIRKSCVPVPTYAQAIFESIDFEKDRFISLKSIVAKQVTRIIGMPVDETIWQDESLDKHLILNIKVVDANGKVLGVDKDISKLKEKLGQIVVKPKSQIQEKEVLEWQWDRIAKTQQIKEYGVTVEVYNCLEIYKNGVKLSYKATEKEAFQSMKVALARLVEIRLEEDMLKSSKNNDLASLSIALKLNDSKDMIVNKAIELSFFNNLQSLPFTKVDYQKFYENGLQSFMYNRANIEKLVEEISKYKKLLDKKLSQKKIPLNFIELFADIRVELEKLFEANYLNVPYTYLQRFKYYVQAFDTRLEKAKQNLQKDRGFKIEVEELEAKLSKVISSKHLDNKSESVVRIKFLIKELWISWYLQSVKTIESVSMKKISSYIKEL